MPMQVAYTQTLHADVIQKALDVNTKRCLKGLPLSTRQGPISVCGNGPSLRRRYPTRAGNKQKEIVALNGAHMALAKHGIIPDYVIAYDPAPENVAWFVEADTHPLYILGSRIDPRCVDLLLEQGCDVVMWHLLDAPERAMALEPLIGGGGTVGSFALNVLAAMGYQHFDLYGYDSCLGLDGEHHATNQPWGLESPEMFDVDGRQYVTTKWMVAQVHELLQQVRHNRFDYTVKVHDDGLFAACLEHNTLDVLYDLNKAPGSFDFFQSMTNIQHHMDEYNFAHARVHFKSGSNQGFRPNEPIAVSHEHKQRMLNNVVRPMVSMFAMEEIGDLRPGAVEFEYLPWPTLGRYRRTGYMPQYHESYEATLWRRHHYPDDYITITLREADYWPQRNSRIEEWVKFANYLGRDKRVIFVRETLKAEPNQRFHGFETCYSASVDIHKRLALYRGASFNMFVVNGPTCLVEYTRDIPYAVFQPSAPGYPCYDPIWLQRNLGLDPYSQWPWINAKCQRRVYADDYFDAIKQVYNELARG